MKRNLFICMLLAVALILSNCSKKDDTTTTTTTTDNGDYNATGTISLTAGGVNYSIPITSVNKATNSITVQALITTPEFADIIISCVSATAAGTGTYSNPSGSSVTFSDKNYNTYQASVLESNSSCTISITTLSSTSIKGTFTASVKEYPAPASGDVFVSITNGVINCTLTSKKAK